MTATIEELKETVKLGNTGNSFFDFYHFIEELFGEFGDEAQRYAGEAADRGRAKAEAITEPKLIEHDNPDWEGKPPWTDKALHSVTAGFLKAYSIYGPDGAQAAWDSLPSGKSK